MLQAFDEGWGGVICKTLSLDSKKVINVTPRYAKLRDTAGKVFGWQVRKCSRYHEIGMQAWQLGSHPGMMTPRGMGF